MPCLFIVTWCQQKAIWNQLLSKERKSKWRVEINSKHLSWCRLPMRYELHCHKSSRIQSTKWQTVNCTFAQISSRKVKLLLIWNDFSYQWTATAVNAVLFNNFFLSAPYTKIFQEKQTSNEFSCINTQTLPSGDILVYIFCLLRIMNFQSSGLPTKNLNRKINGKKIVFVDRT